VTLCCKLKNNFSTENYKQENREWQTKFLGGYVIIKGRKEQANINYKKHACHASHTLLPESGSRTKTFRAH
jgi:hypothetical protein